VLIKEKTIHPKQNPWFTHNIKTNTAIRDASYNKWKRYKTAFFRMQYTWECNTHMCVMMSLNVYLRWSQTSKAWMASAQNLLNCGCLYSLAILLKFWTQQLPHALFPPHGSTRELSLYRKVKPTSDPSPDFLSCQKYFWKYTGGTDTTLYG